MNTFLSLKEKISRRPHLKAFLHRCFFENYRPRKWVKIFMNSFVFHHGKGAVIRNHTILNVTPARGFYVGERSLVEEYTVIDNGVGDVVIGKDSLIGLRSTIIGPVTIGDHVIISQNVVISGLNHNYQKIDQPIKAQGISVSLITVKNGSWIGANVVLTAGVIVGVHAVVAAGSVVTKDVPDYCVVAGNPATVIKRYDSDHCTWERTES